MGMYDHFLGEQFKIFYQPVFYVDSTISEMGYIHGACRFFNKKSTLPLQTLSYKYPDSFLVICQYSQKSSDSYGESNFLLILDKKINKVGWMEDNLDIFNLNLPVYDNYGYLLNVKSFEDVNNLQKERISLRNSLRDLELQYFPKGEIYAIKNNLNEYKRICDEGRILERKIERKRAFNDRWYLPDPDCEVKKFGSLIDCYKTLIDHEVDEVKFKKFKEYSLKQITSMSGNKNVLKAFDDLSDGLLKWVGSDLKENLKLDELIDSFRETIIQPKNNNI